MKLGIIGKGKIVQTLMETAALLPLESIKLLSKPESRESACAFARQHGFQEVFIDPEAFYASDIDAVYIALPNHLHFPYAQAALQAGKHVILEKPAVCTKAEWDELRSLARKQKCILVEAMTTYHLPAFHAIKECLPRIGSLRIANLSFAQRSSRYDAFCQGKIHACFDPKQMGGALMDLNVYNLAMAVGLFGAPSAIGYQANINRHIDTSGIITLTYPGFLVTAMAAKDCGPGMGISLFGDQGTITADEQTNVFSRFSLTCQDGAMETFTAPERHRMYFEFMEFDRIIRQLDYAAAEALADSTGTVIELLQTAAEQAGLHLG